MTLSIPLLSRCLVSFRGPRRERSVLASRRCGRARLEPLEMRCLLASIAEFPEPSPGFLPGAITADPNGNLWFTDDLGTGIGMINASTHGVTMFAVPDGYLGLGGITLGADGNLWFTDQTDHDGTFSGAIGMINPTTFEITEFPENLPNTAPVALTSGPDGNIWFTDIGTKNVGILNPATGAFTQVALPGPLGSATGITSGPDGNIWVSVLGDNAIAMINPTTHAAQEFPIPTPAVGPEQIVVGPDGNLWFTEVYAGNIGVINPTSHVITEIPIASRGTGITAGPGGKLWFNEGNPGTIAMINPTTYAIEQYALPDPDSSPQGITLGPGGKLWFTEPNNNQVGVLDPAGKGVNPISTKLPGSLANLDLTLSVLASPADDAGASSTINLSLTGGIGGDTLVITSGQSGSTYYGLTLKKVGGVYNLLASSPTRARLARLHRPPYRGGRCSPSAFSRRARAERSTRLQSRSRLRGPSTRRWRTRSWGERNLAWRMQSRAKLPSASLIRQGPEAAPLVLAARPARLPAGGLSSSPDRKPALNPRARGFQPLAHLTISVRVSFPNRRVYNCVHPTKTSPL